MDRTRNHITVLVGDFNDRCSNWNSDHRESELGLKLVQLFESYSLTQLINTPTRGENVLDLMVTDAPAYFTDVSILDEISGLDHKIIYGCLAILRQKPKQISRKIWLYNQGNYEFFNDILLAMDWDNLFSLSQDITFLLNI